MPGISTSNSTRSGSPWHGKAASPLVAISTWQSGDRARYLDRIGTVVTTSSLG
jgi:hypothetical protein